MSAFTLVVTDLAMPTFNGLRLIQALREMHGDTPVIAVSGQNADQLMMAEDFGAAATLISPWIVSVSSRRSSCSLARLPRSGTTRFRPAAPSGTLTPVSVLF